MDKTADGKDKQDKGYKNKRKVSHPSMLPASFLSTLSEIPRYELPNSQNSLNEFISSKLGLDQFREELEMRMCELEDWNDPIANQLEDLLLSNLRVIFRGAIKQIVELGYNEKVVEMSISRRALYIEEGNPVSNVVHETLNFLTGKDDTNMDFIFENLQHLLHYTVVEMISVVREVKPSLTDGEAMWVLLISDLNLSQACAAKDRMSDGESSNNSSHPQSKLEVQNPVAIGKIKLKAEDTSLSITTEKSSGTLGVLTQECKSGSCCKRHNRKEIAAFRQRFLHMEKTYRACGKGAFKSGKVSGLILEKSLKPPSEIHNKETKCGSSNTINLECHNSTNDASALHTGSSSGALPMKDTISTSSTVKANTTTPGNTAKPKFEPSSSSTQKIHDYCAGIPFDNALNKYVPQDEKDGLILMLVSRMQDLQGEIQSWNKWTNQKVMQVTDRLGKLQFELKTLRKEKQDAESVQKDKEENVMKMITKMEDAMENNKRQIDIASSTIPMLQTENSLLKKDLDAAKLWVVKSMKSLQQAQEREQKTLKQCQSWEGQNGLLRDEFERERHKLCNLQQELNKEKNLLAKVEGKLAKEKAATEKLNAQAASIKKEREQMEARMKSEEDVIRKKAARDLQKYVEDIANLEKELVDLTLKLDSEKIAALHKCVDGRNDSFSRTGQSTPNKKGNNKSDTSQMMVSYQDRLAAESLRRDWECVMCLSEERSVVFLPCAHQVLCPKCNELHEKQGMKECPSCRTLIQCRIHARFVGH